MTSVKVMRLLEWSNRMFAYNIEVSGQEPFKIKNGEERTLSIDGTSTIQAKLMWCGSGKISLLPGEEPIKQIRISANKGINFRFPLVLSITILIYTFLNEINPQNGAKDFVGAILIGMMIYGLALLTIWRNKFLDIEVVR